MVVSSDSLSADARRVESEMQGYFFRLLRALSWEDLLSPVSRCLVLNCLDEVTGRYADFTAMYAFLGTYALGSSFVAPMALPRRLGLALYGALVGYDVGLRSTTPCPATTFWNSAAVLRSPVGTAARRIHSPIVFYNTPRPELDGARKNDQPQPARFFFAARLVGESILLPRVRARILEGSCMGERGEDGTRRTRLRLNARFLTWYLFSKQTSQDASGVTVTQISLGLVPALTVSPELYQCCTSTEDIRQLMPLPTRWWYRFHTSCIRLFNLQPVQ